MQRIKEPSAAVATNRDPPLPHSDHPQYCTGAGVCSSLGCCVAGTLLAWSSGEGGALGRPLLAAESAKTSQLHLQANEESSPDLTLAHESPADNPRSNDRRETTKQTEVVHQEDFLASRLFLHPRVRSRVVASPVFSVERPRDTKASSVASFPAFNPPVAPHQPSSPPQLSPPLGRPRQLATLDPRPSTDSEAALESKAVAALSKSTMGHA